MTEIVAARLGFGWGWTLGEDNWNAGVDKNFRMNDTFHGLTIIDDTLTAPPGSPADGDTYIPHATATGAWATHEGKIAAYQDGTWYFYSVVKGLRALFAAGGDFKFYNGTTWAQELTDSISNLGTVADKSLLANITGATGTLAEVTFSALLDFIISANEGAIISRGTTGWHAIEAGASGFALVSQGTLEIPQWQSISGGGGGGTITDVLSSQFTISSGTLEFIATPTLTNLHISGTLDAVPLGRGLGLNGGSIEARGTVSYSPTAAGTVTITPLTNTKDVIVNMPSSGAAMTFALSPAENYDDWKLHIKQGATASTLTLNSGFVFPASGGPTSFTLTPTASVRDILWMEVLDGTHAVVGAMLQGITI